MIERKIIDIEVIVEGEYPEFEDSYISKGTWLDTNEELTEEELETLDDGFVYEQVIAELF